MGIQNNVNQAIGTLAIAGRLNQDTKEKEINSQLNVINGLNQEMRLNQDIVDLTKKEIANMATESEINANRAVESDDMKQLQRQLKDVENSNKALAILNPRMYDKAINRNNNLNNINKLNEYREKGARIMTEDARIKELKEEEKENDEKNREQEVKEVNNFDDQSNDNQVGEPPDMDRMPFNSPGAEDLRQQILHSTDPATKLLEKGIGNAGVNQTHGLYAPHTHTPDQANSKAANEIKSKGESTRFMNEVVRNKENPEPKNQLYSKEVNMLSEWNKKMLENGPKGTKTFNNQLYSNEVNKLSEWNRTMLANGPKGGGR